MVQNYRESMPIVNHILYSSPRCCRHGLGEITNKENFVFDIVKTDYEIEAERCQRLNTTFLNKRFTPKKNSSNVWYCICENYFDNIDVTVEHKRIVFEFKLDDNELISLHKKWMKSYDEYEVKGFKYYWSYYKGALTLYRDYDAYDWDSLNEEEKARHKKLFEGISQIITKYRQLTNK